MLDNFSPKKFKEAIEELKRSDFRENVLIEVSGGFSLSNLDKFAQLDIDFVSIGFLTYSANSKDFSFKIN